MKIIKNTRVSCILVLTSVALISMFPCTVMAKDNNVLGGNIEIERLFRAIDTEWKYYITEDGKVYRRLWDVTNKKWLTELILVG